MSEKYLTNKEMAELLEMELHQFIDLMVEIGLLDKDIRATIVALDNGLVMERLVFSQSEDPPDSPVIFLN
jgi:hypothetical protein